jgi:hypothetical protein
LANWLSWVGYRPRWSPWNKGKLTGQKAPLKLKEIWAIRIRLQLAARTRDLAMFNLAIDSKYLRARIMPVASSAFAVRLPRMT